MIRLDFIQRIKNLSIIAYPIHYKDCFQKKAEKMNKQRLRFERLCKEVDGLNEQEIEVKINHWENVHKEAGVQQCG